MYCTCTCAASHHHHLGIASDATQALAGGPSARRPSRRASAAPFCSSTRSAISHLSVTAASFLPMVAATPSAVTVKWPSLNLSEFSRSGVPFPHRRGDRRRSCPEFVFKPATKNVKPGHYAVSYSRSCSDFALLATLICYFYKIFSSAARQRRHKPTPFCAGKKKKSLSARGRRPGQSPHRPWNSSQQVRSSRETTKRNRLLHFVKR